MFSLISANVKSLLTNPVFLACISSWFSAQFIKTVLNIVYGKIHSISEPSDFLLAILRW